MRRRSKRGDGKVKVVEEGTTVDEATADDAKRLIEVGEAMAALLDDGEDFVVCVDAQGIIRYVNRVDRLAARADVEGRKGVAFVSLDQRAVMAAVLSRVLTTGVSASYDSLVAIGGMAAKWYRCRAAPLFRAGGVSGALVIARELRAPPAWSARARVPRAERTRPRVLVVDEEPLIGTALRRILAATYDVEIARRLDDVLALIRSGARYDVILCEHFQAGLDGMALNASVARIDAEQAGRMIFMSGAITMTETERFFFATHELVAKPFSANEIKLAIERVLRAK